MTSADWWPPREGQVWEDRLTGRAGEVVAVDDVQQVAVLDMEVIRVKDRATSELKWKTLAQKWSLRTPEGRVRMLDRNVIRQLR